MCAFTQKPMAVQFINEERLDSGSYRIQEVTASDEPIAFRPLEQSGIIVPREEILKGKKQVKLKVVLGR